MLGTATGSGVGVVSTGAAVGAAVGSGLPPQATNITANSSRLPISVNTLWIDMMIFSFGYFLQSILLFIPGHLLMD
jgi:hypothetical protein